MKKLLFISLLVFGFLSYLTADPVDTTLAKIVAKNQYWKMLQDKSKTTYESVDPVLYHTEQENGEYLYYIYNIPQGKGFVIVSADDRTKPILGYSYMGSYDSLNSPPALKYWINYLKKQIKYVKDNNLETNSNTGIQWSEYLVVDNLKDTIGPTFPIVGPLLGEYSVDKKIEWDQEWPYNTSCPIDPQISCTNCAGYVRSGCVSIAMAQILKYYNYPLQGYGSKSYNHSTYGTISANFGSTNYNWENIPYNFFPYVENYSLSDLIFQCGVSVEMNYCVNCSVNGSTANGCDAVDALVDYFRYDNTTDCVWRISHPSDWEIILKNEIDENRPIIYQAAESATGTNGHAFVCDGYDALDHFYFNWGWNGWYNGFYAITLLDPYTFDFDELHRAVIGIKPDIYNTTQDNYEFDNNYTNAHWIYSNQYQVRSISPYTDIDWIKFNISSKSNVSLETYGIIGNTKMTLYEGDGTTIIDYDYNSGANNFSLLNIDSLDAGTYYVKIDGNGTNECIPSYLLYFNAVSLGGNQPILSNYQVSPVSGIVSDTYEYSVHYYDADGEAPASGSKTVYIKIGGTATPYQMTLSSGTPSDGVYTYTTSSLPVGTHSYYFVFTNTAGQTATSTWTSGPMVFASGCNVELDVDVQNGPVTDNIEVEFEYGPDLGNLTSQSWLGSSLPANVWIACASQLMFHLYLESSNHTFICWEVRDDNGTLIHTNSGSAWGNIFPSNIHATAILDYTPIQYTISGTVLDLLGSIIPEPVYITLESSQQTMNLTSTDGLFSFTGVDGGVPVTISFTANGYSFGPTELYYSNLESDHTSEIVIGYSSDMYSPVTDLISAPDTISTSSNIAFSWTGTDDISNTANLTYQYFLENYDLDWSTWTSNTTANYNLPNGVYKFKVRAQDETGNINQAPTSYLFAVNANPIISDFERTSKAVWSSSLEIKMPNTPINPSAKIILTTDFSGIIDEEIVPVRLYSSNSSTPIGISDLIDSASVLPVVFEKADIGYLFKMPDSLNAGESIVYEIEWGKKSYFGWQEKVTIEHKFKDLYDSGNYSSNFESKCLDNNYHYWISAYCRFLVGTFDANFLWTYFDKIYADSSTISNNIQDFRIGTPDDGTYGCKYGHQSSEIINFDNKILHINTYQKDQIISGSYGPDDFQYCMLMYDPNGQQIDYIESNWKGNIGVREPRELIHDRIIYSFYDQNVPFTKVNKFDMYDKNLNIIIESETLDSTVNGSYNIVRPVEIGENILFLWDRDWETGNGYDRQTIEYQIRNINGQIVQNTVNLTSSILNNSVELDNEFTLEFAVTDKEGKVWISYEEYTEGSGYDYYYIVLDTNGTIWQNHTLTNYKRYFWYVDNDGYIWTIEGDSLYLIDENNNILNTTSKTGKLYPNQHSGILTVKKYNDGYTLFDRWSPQFVSIDIPYDVTIDTMEIYDLDIWKNNLHTADIEIKRNSNSIWTHNGQFNNYEQIDVSSTLYHGLNNLSLTQNDLFGGQILITFPFNEVEYYISGTVILDDSLINPINAEITISGDLNMIINPDSAGFYYFDNLTSGSYTVTASLNGFDFSPLEYTYTQLDSNKYNQDFVGTTVANGFNISGYITLLDTNNSVENVVMILSGDTNLTQYPDTIGYYNFSNIMQGNYILTPFLIDYLFTPTSYSYNQLSTDMELQNFIGSYQNSVFETLGMNTIRIFPNPNHGEFIISVEANIPMNLNLNIINSKGSVISEEMFELKKGTNSILINLSDNAKGVYVLQMIGNDGMVVRKIIVE